MSRERSGKIENKITMGTRRVGDFFDFDPSTPSVKVVLEHSEHGIGITVPWSNDDDPYASWFLRDSGIIHFPSRPAGPAAPKKALFHDSYGPVLLIGCHARGFHTNLGGSGTGTLWARAAIIGVGSDVEFEAPHGLQSNISGLRAWLGMSSWTITRVFGDGQQEITVQSANLPDIKVGERHGVQISFGLNGGISHENNGDRRVLTDFARCMTRSSKSESWTTHMKFHRAIRDLLVLSRWRDESCYESHALHLDDPLRTMDGATHGAQWREVVIPDVKAQSTSKGYQPHLFEYTELGNAGILHWLELRDTFARALDPVISSVSLRNTTANTLLAHTGPGLEALGYLLMLRDGTSKRVAGNAPLRARLERILVDIEDCLPFDSQTWSATTCSIYNGLKHANRLEPDAVDIANSWRQSVLVVRTWVAIELCVSREKVKERLANDPQTRSYVRID